MICAHCEDGLKMPADAKLSVGIAWCPRCTACIRYPAAAEALKTWSKTPDVIKVLECAEQDGESRARHASLSQS